MAAENEVLRVVQSCLHEGWSIEKFLMHCREAWMYTLSDRKEEAESKWTKYTKGGK